MSAQFRQETIRYDTAKGQGVGGVTLAGPSIGGEVGFQTSVKQGPEVSAMLEASLARAETSINLSKNGISGGNGPALLASANLNANTGIKVGGGGVKFGILGLGATMGVDNRWTLDTPIGSVGGSTGTPTSTPNGSSLVRNNGSVFTSSSDKSHKSHRRHSDSHSPLLSSMPYLSSDSSSGSSDSGAKYSSNLLKKINKIYKN